MFKINADPVLGTIHLQVEEGRENLWNKTKEAFKYVYAHHLNDADWFLKTDDDAYVFVENLRYLLYPYSAEMPIHFGHKFKFPTLEKVCPVGRLFCLLNLPSL